MKNLLPKITLLFLLLLPLLGRAQEYCISGRVVDAETNIPIRFAVVKMQREGISIIADENGYFQLIRGSYSEDSLIVEYEYARIDRMAIQNSRTALLIKRGNNEGLEIYLGKPKEKLININQSGAGHGKSWKLLIENGIVSLPGVQYAFLVENDSHLHLGNIRTVSFYIEDTCFPRELFRVRIYKADGNAPGDDLLDELVWLLGPRSEQWYTLDLNKYKIPVPANGYFVALEYCVDEGLRPSYWKSILENYVPTGVIMRPYFNPKESSVWTYIIGKGWNLLPLNNGAFGRFGAMIKVEVDPSK